MSCFALSSSSVCGSGFAGFPVLTNQFTDEAAFNALIETAIAPNITTFQDDSHGCSAASATALSTAVAAMRYQVSFDCVTIVANALNAGCSAPSNTDLGHVVLCGNLCSIAITTYQNVYATQGCTSTAYVTAKLLSRQYACGNMTASLATNKDQTCLLGVSPELNQCGLVSASDSSAYCASNPTDQCCSFPAGVQYAIFNSATDQYYVPSSSATSSGPPVALIGGVVGGVVAVIGIAAIVFFVYRRKKSTPRKTFDNAAMYQQDTTSFRPGQAYGMPQQQQQPMSMPYPSTGRPKPASEGTYLPQQPQLLRMPPTQVQPYKSLVGPSTIAPSTVGSIVGNSPGKSSSQIMRIIHPYEALLQDELDLVEGDDLILVKKFDDGWAQGINPLTGKQGAFPLVCVVPVAEYNSQKAADQKKQARESRMSKRMSSMVGSSIPVNKKASMAISYVSTAVSSVTDASAADKVRNTLRVLFPYQAQQDDELELVVGNDIILLKSFDDGWALGMQPLTGQKGAFPLACVDLGKTDNRISNRASSLMSWQE
ncbi:hypothetical protein HDU84_003657 [Entophlyctis sp. JEL0112]|nr:hypothetical protein HDU84_003657 [Entophlyctis sp. JEL0112]